MVRTDGKSTQSELHGCISKSQIYSSHILTDKLTAQQVRGKWNQRTAKETLCTGVSIDDDKKRSSPVKIRFWNIGWSRLPVDRKRALSVWRFPLVIDLALYPSLVMISESPFCSLLPPVSETSNSASTSGNNESTLSQFSLSREAFPPELLHYTEIQDYGGL